MSAWWASFGISAPQSGRALSGSMLAKTFAWDDPQFLWAALPLVGVLLLGAGIIYFVDRWRKRPGAPPMSDEEQLDHYRVLYAQGHLDQEEFERIKALITVRVRKDLNLPAAPASPSAARSAEASPPPREAPPSTETQPG
jgi:hypothetical protein